MKLLYAFLLSALALCSFGEIIDGDDEGPNHESLRNMRGSRYCEILVSNSQQGFWHLLELTAYNTLMFGCDEKKWNNLTEDDVKRQFSSFLVKMNGPRFWTMDTVDPSSTLIDRTLTYIGDIKWIVVGIVNVSYYDIFMKLFMGKIIHYVERRVNRKTIYIYRENELVYVMTSPEGSTYIMQSASAQYAPLTLDSLSELGSILRPPAGWKYSVIRLEKELAVEAENAVGILINDELFNSYSKFDSSLLFGTRIAGTSEGWWCDIKCDFYCFMFYYS